MFIIGITCNKKLYDQKLSQIISKMLQEFINAVV